MLKIGGEADFVSCLTNNHEGNACGFGAGIILADDWLSVALLSIL
jgi:hypothetical protein